MKLHIPEQLTPTEDAFVSHPEQFKQWLAALPHANTGELTRNIFYAMREHNKQSMADEDRLANLEILREPLRDIFNRLKKHFVNRKLPLPEKIQKIVNLNQSLLREVAIGYKIIVSNITNDKIQKDNLEILSTAICRAIRYQSELILRASEVYAQYPSGTWLDLHKMYDYAEKSGVSKNTISDHENTSGTASIEDYYKQTLLFILARPIALRQRDTERMYNKLSDWAKLTELSEVPDHNEIKRFFCVRVEQDRPPTYLKEEDCKGKYPVRTLDASALAESIQDTITGSGNDDDSSGAVTEIATSDHELSPETLQVLATSWGIFAKRRFTRSARIGYISAAIGLSSATSAIEKENSITKASDPLYEKNMQSARDQLNASLQLLANEDNGSRHEDTGPDRSADKEDQIPFNDPSKMAISGELQLNREDIDLHWEIVNVSAGGYCLRWNSDNTSKAQIGELIALRERETNGTFKWRVGAIRWMQYTREHGLEIGIQLLSPNVCTASIRRKNGPDNSSYNCLVLPGINPLKLVATLLLPTQHFKLKEPLVLNALGQEMEIELCEIKEKTSSFTQSVFRNTGAAIRLYTADSNNPAEEKDDFEEIWSSL